MIHNLQEKKVGVFSSGGLTSWIVCKYLKKIGASPIALHANVGQQDEDHINNFMTDMSHLGIPVIQIDLKNEIADLALDMIKYNSQYEGNYWNSTSALRYAIVAGFSHIFKDQTYHYFAHGCVGGGNDQQRFHQYGKELLNNVEELVMWNLLDFKTKFPSRQSMIDYLQETHTYKGLEKKANYSSDGCLIGMSHEGTQFEDHKTDYIEVKPKMSQLPMDAPNNFQDVLIGFNNGKAVSIDGQKLTSLQILNSLNKIAGKHGVSLKSVFENRINQSKCRGIYESPGMDTLSKAFEALVSLCISYEERDQLLGIQRALGRLMYEGQWLSQKARSLQKTSDGILTKVNGEVKARIYKGNVYILSIPAYQNTLQIIHQKRFAQGGHVWFNEKP